MKTIMKRLVTVVMMFVMGLSTITTVAAEGNVIYSGNAGEFIFAPGGEHSLTDLFPEFKDVMPGDTLTQKIVVKNRLFSISKLMPSSLIMSLINHTM